MILGDVSEFFPAFCWSNNQNFKMSQQADIGVLQDTLDDGAFSMKSRKEDFVAGLSGGTTLDIYKVTSISLTSYLVWCILKKKTNIFTGFTKTSLFSQLLDFFVNWNNLLLSVTVYSNDISLLTTLNILPLLSVFFSKDSTTLKRVLKINVSKLTPKQFLPFKPYITIYRAQMMIITCISILAVDFEIFPRRFAKVETWGTSLMDLGVGSFAFSMGLISARSFLRQKFSGRYNYFKNLLNCIKSTIPLLVLAFARMISVKALDYQEHVTEYGIHWNFFFTLASLPFLANLFSPIIFLVSPLLLSFIIGITYEHFLINRGLLDYIIIAERVDVLSMNREGIFSLLGYLSIFLNGLALGSILLPVIPTPSNLFKLTNTQTDIEAKFGLKRKPFGTFTPLQGLLFTTVLFQLLYYVVDTCYKYGVSRRMTNFLYVLWVSAYNCTFLLGYKLVEDFIWGDIQVKIVKNDDDSSGVLEENAQQLSEATVPNSLTAVNNNSLVIFLLANVSTGVVNMAYNTLDSTTWKSVAVLVAYEGFLAAFSLFLQKYGIKLR